MARHYYLPRPGETSVERFFHTRVFNRTPVPEFPRTIQIQTRSGCNARCSFCPNGRTRTKLSMGVMEWDLYRRIIDECARYDVYRYSPYLMNEPLTDRELGEKIRYITDRKKNGSVTKINSNASLLDEEMGRSLIESGLDRVSFSVHGIEPDVYKESMGNLELEDTLARIDRFLELKCEMRAKNPRVRVTMVKTKLIEPQIPRIRDYWSKRNVKVNIRGLGNRANQDIAARDLNVGSWKPYKWCTDLFDQAFVIWNGDVILCCVDWERECVLGNLYEQSLYEIWNSERYRDIRRRFLAGDVAGLLCGRCEKEPDEKG